MSSFNNIEMCRVCLNKPNILVNIFLPYNKNILKRLREFVEVKDETVDDHPKYICEICVNSLNNSYEFKEKCKNGFETINEMICKSIISEAENLIKFEEIDVKPKLEEEDYSTINEQMEHIEIKEEITEDVVVQEKKKLKRKRKKWKKPDKYDCSQCDESFNEFTLLTIHRKTHKKVIEYKCSFCETIFDRVKERRNHETEVHKNKCNICGQEYQSNLKLNKHIASVHNKSEKDYYECKVCFKKMKFKMSLTRHMKSVHQKEKKHFCYVCSAGFFEIGTLKLHMKSHITTRDFICNVCSKAFKTETCLRLHIRIHNETIIAKRAPKSKVSVKKSSLTKSKVPIKRKQFICQYCGKLFNYKQCYDIHIMIHTKENPWKCEVCDKGFRNKSVLRVHKRMHTGEKQMQNL